jgi:aliphatic nitrilase
MGDRLPRIKAAVVQASSVFLDRDATVRKAVRLIEEAGDLGADLVVFPEGFIPTHPVWFHFHAATSASGRAMARELFRNSVVVGSRQTEELAAASRRAGVWSVVGVCEKRANTTGTMWNSALHFSPEGELVSVHRKITPTSGERLVHMPGDGRGLRIPQAPFGPVSTMICAENFNPLLIFNANAQYPVVHAALWPSHFNTTSQPMRDVILTASRAIAFQNGSFVLNAAGVPDPDSIARITASEDHLKWIADERNVGGSSIVAPNGQVVAGPAGTEETILTADLDLDDLIGKRLVHDYAGHYNRADLFNVVVSAGAGALHRFASPGRSRPDDGTATLDAENAGGEGPWAHPEDPQAGIAREWPPGDRPQRAISDTRDAFPVSRHGDR